MRKAVAINVQPAAQNDENDSHIIEVNADDAFVVYYVVRKMFGCQYNPSPSNIVLVDEGTYAFKIYDRYNWTLQFTLLDLLSRMKIFGNGAIDFHASDGCIIEIMGDKLDEGVQFGFELYDEALIREQAAYRLRYGNDINPSNIAEFYEIPNGNLVCNGDYYRFVDKKAAILLHPDTQYVKNKERAFYHRAKRKRTKSE